jgi:hypothetical protein
MGIVASYLRVGVMISFNNLYPIAIAGVKKPGFFLNISVGCKRDQRNPVSPRNAIAGIKKPGFWINISVGMAKLL